MYIILIPMNTIEAFLEKEDPIFLYLLKFEIGWTRDREYCIPILAIYYTIHSIYVVICNKISIPKSKPANSINQKASNYSLSNSTSSQQKTDSPL